MFHLNELRGMITVDACMSVLNVKLLDVDPQDQAEEEGANVDLDSQRKGKCAVIKTSTRQVSQLAVLLLT